MAPGVDREHEPAVVGNDHGVLRAETRTCAKAAAGKGAGRRQRAVGAASIADHGIACSGVRQSEDRPLPVEIPPAVVCRIESLGEQRRERDQDEQAGQQGAARDRVNR
jgi:hypothetical protein